MNISGEDGIRTHDLLTASQVLYTNHGYNKLLINAVKCTVYREFFNIYFVFFYSLFCVIVLHLCYKCVTINKKEHENSTSKYLFG